MWPETTLNLAVLTGGRELALRVPTFSLVFFLALGLGVWVWRRELHRRGLEALPLATVLPLGLGAFFLAAHLSWSLWARGRVWVGAGGGFEYWGGLGGLGLSLVLWARWRRWSLGLIADAAALGLTAMAVPLRLASLLDGGYTGLPIAAEHPLAIRFSTAMTGGSFLGWETPAGLAHRAGAARGEYLHPTALYAALGFLALHCVLRARRAHRREAGELAAGALLGGGMVSFLAAFWRGDLPRETLGLSRAHLCAAAAIVLGGLLLGWRRRRV